MSLKGMSVSGLWNRAQETKKFGQILKYYQNSASFQRKPKLVLMTRVRWPILHGHIGSNQMNQNVKPKIFF